MKVMNHSEYPKSMKSKTWQELEYIIKDAKAAISANPENPNNVYYQDEICYAAQEKKKRMDRATSHV
jgi:hypothetical protein